MLALIELSLNIEFTNWMFADIHIIKCHRAFLVNLRHVVKVSGNAQGYRLQVGECREEVLVSRAYIRVVKDYFEDMRRGR